MVAMGKQSTTELAVGAQAPDFTLTNDIGESVSLHDFAGKWLVLYFYPRDDSPGCTIEACSLRDARDEITALGAEIIGISKDAPTMHEKFKARHSINFALLSDPTATTIQAYGAWNRNLLVFKHIVRKTYVVNPEGRIAKVYAYTTPLGTGSRIAADLRELQKIAAMPTMSR
jgi:thioredoxin-dependent peroxiredoxin